MLNTLQEMSDEKLMAIYQNDDLYAFNALYQRYEHRIYGYFHRFFPEERCADLLQDTFLKVHRSRLRYNIGLPFSKWLFSIARNLAKDEFKRLSRLKEYLDDGQLEDTQTFLADPETPESIVEHDELLERIRQAILDLPENHREAMGKSYPEIAESMEISVGAVKQRAYRGLLTLREKLKDLVEPEFKEKAKKGFSALMIFRFQDIVKKVLIGGLEAMKISAKVKIVTIGVAALLMLGGTGIIIWHYQSKQETLNPIVNQINQKVATALSKDLLSKSDSSNKYISTHLTNQMTANQEQKGEQLKKAVTNTGLIGETSKEAIDSKETPSELLQRWYGVRNTTEFQAYAHNIIDPLFNGEISDFDSKIEELENNEKKLQNDLETASSKEQSNIQLELEKVRANLWNTRVLRSEKLILIADAIWSVDLKYFTNDDLLTVRKEIGRTTPLPSLPTNPNKDRDERIKTEAMTRLKATGWVPASPDESWY